MCRPAPNVVDAAMSIAQRFVAQWVADEYPYFSVLWSSVAAAWQDRREGPPMTRPHWKSAVEGLGFAKATSLAMQSPFVMIATLTILDELEARIVPPDPHALERGIVACAREIGSSEPQAREMGRKLAPLILQQWQVLHADRPSEISPGKARDAVVVSVSRQGLTLPDGRSVALQKQQRQLLAHLLREGTAHWSDGYVFFDRWARSRVKSPRRQFEVVCSRLNVALARLCPGLRVTRLKEAERHDESWRLEVPPHASLSGDVVTARMEAETAAAHFGNTDATGALAHAGQALDKDPESGPATRLFLRALDNVSGASVSAEHLRGIYRNLLRQSVRLENAVTSLDAVARTGSGMQAMEDLSDARQRLRLRLDETRFLFEKLRARLRGLPPPPKEQQAFDQFIGAIRRYKTAEGRAQTEAFGELTSTGEVKGLIKKAARYAAKCLRVRHRGAETDAVAVSQRPSAEGKHSTLDEVPAPESETEIGEDRYVITQNDVLSTVYEILGKTLMERYEPTDFATLNEGVRALKRLVTQGTVEALIETGYGIASQQQQDMRTMRTFIQKQGPPSETRLSTAPAGWPKGWNQPRRDISVKTESLLADKINMQAYYGLYRRKAQRAT